MTAMTDQELKRIIDKLSSASVNAYDSGEQSDALDYYYGRPYGNEETGRSQVTTSEVMEAVEWSLPALIRVFVGGDRVVKFNPTSEDDEEAAEQESDVVNHVFREQNNGFLICYDWFKDALLQRNGYVKVYWDEEEEIKTDVLEGLVDMQLAEFDDENTEIIEHDERIIMQQVMGPMGPMEMPVTLHDIKVRRTKVTGGVVIENIPVEELKVSNKCRSVSLDDAEFVQHETTMKVTDLLELGVDAAIIEQLSSHVESDNEMDSDRSIDDDNEGDEDSPLDSTMRDVAVKECYLWVDFDGDGKAEYRKVLKSGSHILLNDEFDYCPMESLTPVRMPHKHQGMSKADQAMQTQLVKSTLLRQMLDNLYLTNNPEKEVDENNVNIDDLLSSTPGGIKRVTMMGSIREIAVPFTAAASMPMMDLLDTMLQKKTGISMQTMAMDADVLSNSTKGAFMGAMEKGNEQMELMARLFAETGIKGLFRKIHHLLKKHQDTEMTIKLRGKWTPVKPQSWRERTDMTISVGLGTASKDALVQRLLAVAQKQVEALTMGLPVVTPQNYYKTMNKLSEAVDLGEGYFTDPSQIPPKEPPPDPNMMLAQMQIKMAEMQEETKRMLAQMDSQLKMQEIELKQRSFERDTFVSAAGIESEKAKTRDTLAAAQKKEVETALLANQQPDNSIATEMAKLEQQTAIALHKANVQAEVDLEKTMIGAAAQMMASQQSKPKEEQKDAGVIREMLQQNAEMLKNMSKPKKTRIIRDENGKATGSEQD